MAKVIEQQYPDKCPACGKDMEVQGLVQPYTPVLHPDGRWECPHCSFLVGGDCRCGDAYGGTPFHPCPIHGHAGSAESPCDARGLWKTSGLPPAPYGVDLTDFDDAIKQAMDDYLKRHGGKP